MPTVLRLSDESESAVNLARPDAVGGTESPGGCLMITGYEGTPAQVARAREATTELLAGLGGQSLGTEPGEAWSRGRFDGPYLRDSLLDVGVLVETFETVTFWSRVEELYVAVKGAVEADLTAQGTPPLVLCHISHVYETGASLYFTVAAKELDDGVGQWLSAKRAASDAMIANGASITHHHAVGRDHKPWLARGDRARRGRGAARGQGPPRPGRRPQPRRPDPVTPWRPRPRCRDLGLTTRAMSPNH